MTYLAFTPGFADKLVSDYMDGRDLTQSIPGTSGVEAEHFAAQMVAVAALHSLPLDELGDLEGPGALRNDLVSLSIVERLREYAGKHPRRRAALLDRAQLLLVRVAESPVATTAIWYEDLYLELGWSFSTRGEHARAIDMARRAVAHSIAFDEGRNVRNYLRDLARHTFVARPDEGARLWVRIVRHDPTDMWTYVQLGHLGADVGLAKLARRARLRGIHALRGRDDADARSVRKQLEREAGERVEARPVAISPDALAELDRALDGDMAQSERADVELARELVPDLASVPVKRRPTAADLPLRERVLAALRRPPPDPPEDGHDLAPDLRSRRSALGGTPAPVRAGPKVGRNDPCPCGSGRKWKKCCGSSAGA